MATIPIPNELFGDDGPEPWPTDEHSIRVDEMFARQLDTEFAGHVRGLLHDPETGLSALKGEAALEAIAGVMPALQDLKERTLGQAIGPVQRSLLQPMIDTRLDWAAGAIGQLAHRATVEVDDQSVAERLAGLGQDASSSWRDRAHMRKLGRTAVNELRYQGERRGWDAAETDAKVRGGLSDLYAGAVEAAIGQDDLDGAAALYEHARPVLDPERQAAIDRRFMRAREVALYRDIDRDLASLPIEPAGPPGLDIFEQRAAELTPDNASDTVRAGIAQVADHAHRHAERQWHKRQAEAGLAVLDWVQKNPGASFLAIPMEVRDWLAPDQWQGFETLAIDGRLTTDGALFERLDRQMVHEPEVFAAVDLDRHRLSLGEVDYTRFAAAQKAIAEGRIDPDLARYDRLRLGLDRELEGLGIDLDGPVAAKIRADARGWLKGFEAIEGRPPNGEDIAGIVDEVIGRIASDKGTGQGPSPAAGDAFDPRQVVPAQAGGRPPSRPPAPSGARPAPGVGHNNPPRPLSPYEQAIENTRRLMQPPPPSAPQPQPGTAGPAASATGDEGARPRQDGETAPVIVKDLTRLSPGEIRMLKKGGFDVHEEKKKGKDAPLDLFKDREGNIFRGRQDRQGEAEPLHDNITNYR